MKAVGIILAGGNSGGRLEELTTLRAASAMPVGGCYRVIDFPLSNMANSGIAKVAIITQYNSRSLHDHLSSSKWWDLGRKQGGLFIFTPFLSSDQSFGFRGTADSIFQNISYLRRSNEPYVVITSGDSVYKIDYNLIIQDHVRTKADITIVSREMPGQDVRPYGVMEIDENNRVIEFEEKPLEPSSSTISLGIYIISRILLIKLLEVVIQDGRYDFVRDVITRYRKKLNIYAYNFTGYWRALNSVQSYYELNMDFLKRDVRDLFTKQQPFIATKPKDEPPAKYNHGAHVVNSLISSGSILNGAVSNSVLFRRVYTGEYSSVKNSIIMESSFIGNGCIVENAILDKEVILSDGKQIIGNLYDPVIIPKSTVM